MMALTGLWRALTRPGTSLHVDGTDGVVSLTRWTLLGRRARRWPTAQIKGFARAQRPGGFGAPLYRLRLDLADGEALPAAALWQADPSAIDAIVSRANALLGK
jgi:hypothetical protein